MPAVAEEAAVSTVAGIPPSASEAGPAAAAGVADIPSSVSEPPRVGAAPRGPIAEGALNVIGTVVPVLLKRFVPALAVLGLLLIVVIKIMRRRS